MTFPSLWLVANKHAGDVIAPHCIKVIHSSYPFADKIDGPLSSILHYFVIVKYNQLLMHPFYLAILSLIIKLCIHGQSFLAYSLPVLMVPPHFATSECTVYYGKLIVTPLRDCKNNKYIRTSKHQQTHEK